MCKHAPGIVYILKNDEYNLTTKTRRHRDPFFYMELSSRDGILCKLYFFMCLRAKKSGADLLRIFFLKYN